MKMLVYFFSFSILGLALISHSAADEHGGVHIRIPTCEGVIEEEGSDKVPEVCWELKPWYSHQHYEEYEDIETQADQLQDDTAWPGQREDFSDYLMR